MLRHVALFRFNDDMTAEQVEAAAAALRTLPAQIPELLAYDVGPDVGMDDGNADFAVVADFADAAGYRTYVEHPAHQAVANEHIRPNLAARTAVQYEAT